ncbi:hypothetical protein FAI41_00905 [Acetobacteraceae bacterium]|nr:hypothetical protein FAI41_00905 [Acetobacteraceae bacterium]
MLKDEAINPVISRNKWMEILNFLHRYQYQPLYGSKLFEALDMDGDTICANLYYLKENSLIEVEMHRANDGKFLFGGYAELTPKGIDYLSEDGGLSAELNVISIKFDVSQIQMLIETHINASDAPTIMKKKLQDALKQLPADSLKSICKNKSEIK